jgi:hypothetical protein
VRTVYAVVSIVVLIIDSRLHALGLPPLHGTHAATLPRSPVSFLRVPQRPKARRTPRPTARPPTTRATRTLTGSAPTSTYTRRAGTCSTLRVWRQRPIV